MNEPLVLKLKPERLLQTTLVTTIPQNPKTQLKHRSQIVSSKRGTGPSTLNSSAPLAKNKTFVT